MTQYKNYGYLAAVDPPYAVQLSCDTCQTTWVGCMDACHCPECRQSVPFDTTERADYAVNTCQPKKP